MQRRFLWAMAAYGALALFVTFALDGKFRLVLWIFLGGLALKTVIAYKRPEL
jgi:hypothetical protein